MSSGAKKNFIKHHAFYYIYTESKIVSQYHGSLCHYESETLSKLINITEGCDKIAVTWTPGLSNSKEERGGLQQLRCLYSYTL